MCAVYPPQTRRTAFASAARTADPTDAIIANPYEHPRALIHIDVTAASDTPSVVFNILTETSSGNYAELIESAAITGTGDTIISLGVGTSTNNVATVHPPGKRIKIDPVHADSDSITYGVYVIFCN